MTDADSIHRSHISNAKFSEWKTDALANQATKAGRKMTIS